jgi:hypothetical protein
MYFVSELKFCCGAQCVDRTTGIEVLTGIKKSVQANPPLNCNGFLSFSASFVNFLPSEYFDRP